MVALLPCALAWPLSGCEKNDTRDVGATTSPGQPPVPEALTISLDPNDLAVDGWGNIFVFDHRQNTIFKITPTGNVKGLVWGYGETGGLATDSAGYLYASFVAAKTVSRINGAGVVTTLGTNFEEPYGVALDGAGNLYVARGDHTIRKIAPNGATTIFAGQPGTAGAVDGETALFNTPIGLAADSAGNVYVADKGNNTIRKISPDGKVTTLAGSAGKEGDANGRNSAARFKEPTALAVDRTGNVYVIDNQTIRKIAPSGIVSTLAGSAGHTGHDDGKGAAASFSDPLSIATDSAGNVYVADTGSGLIRKITPDGVVTTIAGRLRGSPSDTNEGDDEGETPGDRDPRFPDGKHHEGSAPDKNGVIGD